MGGESLKELPFIHTKKNKSIACFYLAINLLYEEEKMSETISINNSKGGVAKSTSVITIAQILAISGYKILIIDLDPQMNTTKMYGQTENHDVYIEHMFCSKQLRKSSVEEFIAPTSYPNISIISASKDYYELIYKIHEASKNYSVELTFRNNLEYIKEDYDYIIIDNSPFKSALSNCSICASDGVLTPINADNFSYDGLMDLIETIQNLNEKYSLSINFTGIYMTRVSNRTNLFKQMFENYEEMFEDKFIPVSIRQTDAVNQSNTSFIPLLTYDKRCTAAQDYIELVNYLGLMDNKHYKKLIRYMKGEK